MKKNICEWGTCSELVPFVKDGEIYRSVVYPDPPAGRYWRKVLTCCLECAAEADKEAAHLSAEVKNDLS